jgi:hypothetical protein
MRKIREAISTVACVAALMLMALPVVWAAETGHEGMQGMKGHEAMQGKQGKGGDACCPDTMKQGDKVFSGKVGPWQGEARLIDMKAQMEKAMSSGMKMEGAMKSHHLALGLSDPKAKKAVTEGKGAVTVTGPDKKSEKADFMVMGGHFGADVNLPKPGKYTFKTDIESGGKKGSATFTHVVK